MEFRPPIPERNTDELIRIKSNPERWDPLAVEQAKKELLKRKVPNEYKRKKIAIWNRFFKRKQQATMQRRSEERYKLLDFILHPTGFLFEVLFDWNLKADGYTKKHEQRKLILINLGMLLALIYVMVKFGT